MVNARNFVFDNNDLCLKFRFSGNPRINCISIKLNGSDLYDITFYKVSKIDFVEVDKITDVFCEDLVRIIESKIGLYLSLGTLGKRRFG